MARLLSAAPRIRRQNARVWLPPLLKNRLDQGRTSSCVEHAITHAVYGFPQPRRQPVPWPHFALYRKAQDLDEWPGAEPLYYGTSLRAGLQAATEPWLDLSGVGTAPPVIESYYRVEDYEDLLDLLCADDYSLGCSICIGTDWSNNMFQVDDKGYLFFHPTEVGGGHAWWLNYANIKEGVCGGLTSWGTQAKLSGMMQGGGFKLPLSDLRLLWDRGADGWVIIQPRSPFARIAREVAAALG